MSLTFDSLKSKVVAGAVTALSGGFIWFVIPYAWDAVQHWDDHEDQHTEIEDHMEEIDLLELDDIEDNKEHNASLDNDLDHLLRDVHDVQMRQMRMEGLLEGLEKDRGFTFNRLEEVETTQNAAVRRDSISKSVHTIKPRDFNHGEDH